MTVEAHENTRGDSVLLWWSVQEGLYRYPCTGVWQWGLSGVYWCVPGVSRCLCWGNWNLLSLALWVWQQRALCARGKAGELEAALELQINEFSAFVNVKGDYRQNTLGTSLGILQGRSLNALLLHSGRALACYQPCSCHRVTAAGALPVLRKQLLSGRQLFLCLK